MTAIPAEIREVREQADCLFTETQVEHAIDTMATDISRDLEQTNPIVFSVMNGGLVLTGKLVTKLGFPLEISYLHATRYRDKTSGADLEWRMLPQQSLEGRTILVVDDIYDEGATLGAIVDHCREAGVAEIKIAVLVDKQHNRKARPDIVPDYVGLQCEDRYVFGYGMDYKGYWRNAPGIYAVKGL
ncbi:hypoxanthine-guanine phosphoribosyltransferase [Saccharospirillum sp. MSK14-1]|uniref:hypoxanthine-guanine phosphoribosyltransferase n=1 Tax=Saccharospirillum sp. MSK14-1 TaxID=1897632 RepID=UPI000D3487F0|nr:hypoxanthine-guanine phosphoribosyltransferase [Saccharospirillum sp. MSK14-1]PTY37487.1 hypoxanthine-guanine phosphoribosyltransferase [Saccharospirillum sp. MSK14-1]